jgi:hypothetical protein
MLPFVPGASRKVLNAVEGATDIGRAVNKTWGKLHSLGNGVWESISSGLRYGPDPRFPNRVQHVLNHASDIPTRAGMHGVFDTGRDALTTIDQAWEGMQQGYLDFTSRTVGNRTTYIIDTGGRIGYVGGQGGAVLGNPAAQHLLLVVDNGKDVVTAYPYIPTP